MPTYDYTCDLCGHALEAFQKITDSPLKECPQCKNESLVRGFGGGSTSFRFMGSGFYITDYKKDSSCGACGDKQGSCSSKS